MDLHSAIFFILFNQAASTNVIVVLIIVLFLIIGAILVFINQKNKIKYKNNFKKYQLRMNDILADNLSEKLNAVLEKNTSIIMKVKVENWISKLENVKTEKIIKTNELLKQVEELLKNDKYKETSQYDEELNTELTKIEHLLKIIKDEATMFIDTFTNEIENIQQLKTLNNHLLEEFYKNSKSYEIAKEAFNKKFNNIKEGIVSYEAVLKDDSSNYNTKAVELFDSLKVRIAHIEKIMVELPKVSDYINKITEELSAIYQKYQELIECGYVGNEHFENNYNININKLYSIIDEVKELNYSKEVTNVLDEINQFLKTQTFEVEEEFVALTFLKNNLTKVLNGQQEYYKLLNNIKGTYYKNYPTLKTSDDFSLLQKYSSVLQHDIIKIKQDVILDSKGINSFIKIKEIFDEYYDRFKIIENFTDKLKIDLDGLLNEIEDLNEIIDTRLNEVREMYFLILRANLPKDKTLFVNTLKQATESFENAKHVLLENPYHIHSIGESISEGYEKIQVVLQGAKQFIDEFALSEFLLVYSNRLLGVDSAIDVELIIAEDMFRRGKYSQAIEKLKTILEQKTQTNVEKLIEEISENGHQFYV